MYYLLKTFEIHALGGSSFPIYHYKLIRKSPLKENLISYLADKFMDAMDDNYVEFINGYVKDDIDEYELSDIKNDLFNDNIESFERFISNHLMIQYYSDGIDFESFTYVILDDEETELII